MDAGVPGGWAQIRSGNHLQRICGVLNRELLSLGALQSAPLLPGACRNSYYLKEVEHSARGWVHVLPGVVHDDGST